ncbi:MAG: NAD-dependent epimerase/dehydratase family protein [Stenotrophomonas sp.]
MITTALPARVLILGLGYSGRYLASELQRHGIHCSGSVRDPAAADGLVRHRLGAGTPIQDDLRRAIDRAEAVVCTIPPDADGDPALRLVRPLLAASPALRWVGYLSSTAVYADRGGGWVDETSLADAVEERARARLLAEQQWQALARARGIASAVLRLPGLYGPGRNALVQLAQGRARHLLKASQVFNRLQVEDLATAVCAAMAHTGHALYLPADDEPAPSQDVLAYAARLAGLPLPPAQAWDADDVPPSVRLFYAHNKRIDSRATRARLDWQPRYRSYRDGLDAAWALGDGRRPAAG